MQWVKALTTNTKLLKKMIPRYMHTMTTVLGYSNSYFDENQKYLRALWTLTPTYLNQVKIDQANTQDQSSDVMGIYIFGGIIQKEEIITTHVNFSIANSN